MLTAFAEWLIALAPLRYQNSAKQFVKFGITGSLGAIIDYSSYITMTRGLGWHTTYPVLGFDIIGANVISVLLAISVMFFVNKYWTFRNREERVLRQGVGYFTLNLTTFVGNQILTSFFAFQVPMLAILFGSAKDLVAKALAIGIILFLNFFGSKFIVFREARLTALDQNQSSA